jgi:hypothetical protein
MIYLYGVTNMGPGDGQTGRNLTELTVSGFNQEITRSRRQGVTVKFIRGPLPHEWFSRACRLGGKCANLALALWYVHGMGGSPIMLPRRIRSEFGLGDSSTYYALQLMEKKGLVRVERRRGRAPRVTLLKINNKEMP